MLFLAVQHNSGTLICAPAWALARVPAIPEGRGQSLPAVQGADFFSPPAPGHQDPELCPQGQRKTLPGSDPVVATSQLGGTGGGRTGRLVSDAQVPHVCNGHSEPWPRGWQKC
jgi:hypothetical protein